MRGEKGIAQLQDLAALMRDHRLAQLRDAARKCDQSRMQMSALACEPSETDLDPVTSQLVVMRYQGWADVRRSELNIVLARQTVDWLQAQADARLAFGRAEALRSVIACQTVKK